MNTNFKSQYEILGLSEQTDWPTVQHTYRRLVHEWHPDRHLGDQRQNELAEQRFIQLTQAFNTLRDFQRKNHRLPLQSHLSGQTSNQTDSAYGSHVRISSNISDEELAKTSILYGERGSKHSRSLVDRLKKNRVLVAAGLLSCFTILTVALMFVLDKRGAQKTYDQSIESRMQSGSSQSQ